MSRLALTFPGRVLALVTLLSGLALPTAWSQSANLSYDPNVDGNVYAMARQPDGKLLIAGGFLSVNANQLGDPSDRQRMARLNPDGSLDPGFRAEFDNDVSSIVLQPDGRIVVGGKFTTVRSDAAADPIARNGLARLMPDGQLDLTYDPNPQGSAFPQALVRAMAQQADGRIIIGGGFSGFQPNATGAIIARNRIARLNTDGTIDPAFDPNASNVVLALALAADGRILVGGGFLTLQPNGAAAPVAMTRLARLNADGTVDTSFSVQPNNRVTALHAQADGSILVGGDFLTVTIGSGAATTAPHLFRLDPTGAFDAGFDVIPNGPVNAIATQADGRILLGGSFGSFFSRSNKSTITKNFVARLMPGGSLDFSFSAVPTAAVHALAVEPDGSIVIGGAFMRVQGAGSSSSLPRRRVARLQPNGSLDSAFNVNNGGTINASVRLPDGGAIYAGSFAAIAGVTRSYIARVTAAGEVDLSFAPEFNNAISAIGLQSDGKLVVAGNFTRIDGETRQFIARLNADGSLDGAYDPKANAAVTDLVLQSDGKAVVAGTFTSFTPNGATEAQPRNFIARLNADGTVDAFNPSAGSLVGAIALQPDGKILIGGQFTSLRPGGSGNAIGRSYFARLNADGTVDPDFNVSLNSTVDAIAVQSDGKIVIGGLFTGLAPSGATEITVRNRIARLNADGTVDTAFDPNANALVSNIALLPDGTIAITGNFTTLQPNDAETASNRRFFAWLNADGTAPDARAFGFNSGVSMLALQESGLLVAGSFDRILVPPNAVGVATEGQIVRFNLDGTFDENFAVGTSPDTSGYAGAIAVQPDGRVVVGGSFNGLIGSENQNLLRVDADGSPDRGFFAKPDGAVNSVLILPASSDVDAAGGPVGWLTAEGNLLPAFDPTNASTLSGTVYAIARQSDGKLLVGGSIGNSFGVGSNLVRFNADGSVDTSFAPAPNDDVFTIVAQTDGKILIGGDFTRIGEATRNHIARLNADGTLDTAFDPNANSTVSVIRQLSDGKILLGGSFTTFQPNAAAASTSRAYMARLNADGTLDTGFTPGVNSSVSVITLQSDGKILIGGQFTAISGTTRSYMARLEANGAADASFTGRANSNVSDIAVLGDGKILVAGTFTSIQNNPDASAVVHPYLARLNTDGTLDAAFDPAPGGAVNSIEVQSDGRILIGGSFSYFLPDENADPIFKSSLARLNADGTIDPTFNPIPDGTISTIALFPDGSFAVGGNHSLLFPEALTLVGGEFQNFSETPVANLARLYSNGLVDVTFPLQPDGAVHAMAMQPDRAVVVAGAFTAISETPRLRLARMSTSGELDASFDPAADAAVHAVVILPDGRIAAGGEFTTIGGAAAQRIAVLTAAGTLDGSFSAAVDGAVDAIVAQADGRFVIGGAFTTVNGAARPYLARLNADGTLDASYAPAPDAPVSALALQGDGRVIAGGAFAQIGGAARAGVARLEIDGTLDTSYTANADGPVRALALQYNGGLVVGGGFSEIAGVSRPFIARLSSVSLSSEVISVDAGLTAATLSVGGASGDYSSVQFSYSEDAKTWTLLGAGTRTGNPGEWRVTGLSLPAASTYYLRVDGLTATSQYGSGGARGAEAQFFGATPAASFVLPASHGNGDGGNPSGSDGGSGHGNGGGGDTPSGGGSGSDGAGGDNGPGAGDEVILPGGGSDSASFGVINLSGRGYPLATEPLITGFVVAGDGPREILLRAVGPGLAAFGVDEPLEAPILNLYDSAGRIVQQAAAWAGSASVTEATSKTGAFDLDPAALDAAAVVTLAPGAYTAHLTDQGGLGGVALGEVYLVPAAGTNGTLANVSVRGPVGAGDSILVAGFVIESHEPQTILVRGIGPGLAAFGVADATSDPRVGVYDGKGAILGENDDWAAQTNGSSTATISAATTAAKAFPLPAESKDSALLVTLPKGRYTIQLSARELGSALIEIYAVP